MLLDKLYEIVKPATNDLGYILWGIEVLETSNITIIIFIDHENGISIDDCQIVSKELSTIFDFKNPISGKYILQVSSPGMDRKIFNLSQAQTFVGFNIEVVTDKLVNLQTKFKGLLEKIDGDNLFLRLKNNEQVKLNFISLKKIRVSPEFISTRNII